MHEETQRCVRSGKAELPGRSEQTEYVSRRRTELSVCLYSGDFLASSSRYCIID